MVSAYHIGGVNEVVLLSMGQSSASCGSKAFAHTYVPPTDIDDNNTNIVNGVSVKLTQSFISLSWT